MQAHQDNPLRHTLATGRRALLPVGLFSMVFNLLALTVPLYMMQVYDRVLTSGSLETLLYLSLIAIFVILVMAWLDVTRSAIAMATSNWLERRVAPDTFARAVEASLVPGAAQGDDYTTQSLRDLGTVRNFIGGQTLFVLFDALWAPVYLAVIFLLHPLLGILALAGTILLAALALVNELVTRGPLRGAGNLWMRGMRDAEMAARNAEAVIGMGMTAGVTAKWLTGNERMQALQIQASRSSTTIVATTKVIRLILQIGVLGLGAFLVLDHAMTAGQMIAGSIIMSRALAPVETAIGTWKQIVDYRTARSRLLRFFDKPTVPRTGTALPVPSGQLSVEGVVFAPPGAEEPTLKRVTFAADPGEVVAIVGPSAAGKSTLARLLVAAWRPTAGVIRLDDADVYEWPRDDFGRYVGYLPQDVELFAGTVRENIARMADADADNAAEVFDAARLAGVHEMVLRLPKGYETEIGSGGARLSAGQRQRIALARAVFGRPRLIVLDEPNANLDVDGEMALAKAVVALRERGTTVVVISHRQNILMQADKILVLRHGTVEMFGARNEVLRRILPGARREPGTTPATTPKFAEQRTP